MYFNNKGVKLIEDFEGFEDKAYLCPGGKWTIGFGTTVYPDGTKVAQGDGPISKETAYTYLKHDLKYFIEGVKDFLIKKETKLNSNQFSALVCFVYNVGLKALIDSDKTMYKAITGRNWPLAGTAFGLYTKVTKINAQGVAKKVELSGLVRRRKAEADLFFLPEIN